MCLLYFCTSKWNQISNLFHSCSDSPNATPSQSRTTFNSSPPLGPFGGGDTPSAISGYGEISPQSLTTDGSLSPLTGGGSSSGLPSFPDPAVITPIDGHQVWLSKIINTTSLLSLIR